MVFRRFFPVCMLVVLSFYASKVNAHASLTEPASREQGWMIVEDKDVSIGCGSSQVGKITTFEPGQVIKVRYPRNNHVGGFIRWSIVPYGTSESSRTFDENVFLYTCRESGNDCHPAGNKPFSLFLNVEDGVPNNQILCGDTIQLPDWLPQGQYVLQWTAFSTGTNYGFPGISLPVYRSCADIKLSSGGTGKKPSCPSFVGGDRGTKGSGTSSDQCLYFHSNQMEKGIFNTNGADATPLYKFGKPKYVEECSSSSSGPAPAPIAGSTTNGCLASLTTSQDFEGNDIGQASASKAEDCCNKCQKFKGCQAFAWSGYNGGTCFFKSRQGPAIRNKGVITGVLAS